MKKAIPTIALLLAASAFTALAQEAATTPTPPAAKHEGHRPGGPGAPVDPMMRAAMETLSPAEREQLMAASKKAMEDPAVIEARKNLETARRAALLKVDPNIGPVLDKMEAAMKERGAQQPKKAKPE
jgi:hypothetical protein